MIFQKPSCHSGNPQPKNVVFQRNSVCRLLNAATRAEHGPKPPSATTEGCFSLDFAVFVLRCQYFFSSCPHPPRQEPTLSWGNPGDGGPPAPEDEAAHLHRPVAEKQKQRVLGGQEAQQAGARAGGRGQAPLLWTPGHTGSGPGDPPPPTPTRPATSPGPHLSPPLPPPGASQEPQDGQLGAQRAGHVPRGVGLQLPTGRHVADAAGDRAEGGLAVTATSPLRTPSHPAT